ncbi:XRE family transcriptional regulator [Streptomyces sp. NPDC002623]
MSADGCGGPARGFAVVDGIWLIDRSPGRIQLAGPQAAARVFLPFCQNVTAVGGGRGGRGGQSQGRLTTFWFWFRCLFRGEEFSGDREGDGVAQTGGYESALKLARTSRNWTLEDAAERLNAMTGGGDRRSLMSGWEFGRHRTGAGNRAALCQLYRERSQALFAHQDGASVSALEESGTAVVVRVLTRWADLTEAMIEVVVTAQEWLIVTGSRSREKSYLSAIETAVAQVPDLLHYRVLYGPPRHRELTDHLLRLLDLRDPRERRHAAQTLRIGIVEQPWMRERLFVASECAAVVPPPSFHGAEGFDCGILLGREAAVGLVQHGREACASARPVETAEAVLALAAGERAAGKRGET